MSDQVRDVSIHLGRHPEDCRVEIGGEDITRFVCGVDICARPGGMPEATLLLSPHATERVHVLTNTTAVTVVNSPSAEPETPARRGIDGITVPVDIARAIDDVIDASLSDADLAGKSDDFKAGYRQGVREFVAAQILEAIKNTRVSVPR